MERPTVNITIRTANAAFDDAPEVEIGRILRKLAEDIERPGGILDDVTYHPTTLQDINGNTTGTISLDSEEEA